MGNARALPLILVTVFGVFGLASCESTMPAADSELDQELARLLAAAGVTAVDPPPIDNSHKVELGRMLFFDKILSGNRNISCATCHTPHFATGDGLPLAIGQGGTGMGPNRQINGAAIIPRNAPATFDRKLLNVQFFDGRVVDNGDGYFTSPAGEALPPGLDDAFAALEMFPVTDRGEMRGHPGDPDNELALREDEDLAGIWADLTARIMAISEYSELVQLAYPQDEPDDISFVHMANAMSAFQGKHFSALDSRFDMYLRGDLSALTDSEKRGATLFFGNARCGSCHSGPLLTDLEFHNRVVPQLGPGKGHGPEGEHDFGREGITGLPEHRFRFRTQPLRNVAVTGPWFHSGAVTTLEGAVRHELDPVGSAENYDPGQLDPRFAAMLHPEQTPAIVAAADPAETAPVSLTDAEVSDLVAFLRALTSMSIANLPSIIPFQVPSGLPVTD